MAAGLVVVLQNELYGAVGNEPARDDFLAIHFAGRAEVDVSIVDTHRRAVVAGVVVVTEHLTSSARPSPVVSRSATSPFGLGARSLT